MKAASQKHDRYGCGRQRSTPPQRGAVLKDYALTPQTGVGYWANSGRVQHSGFDERDVLLTIELAGNVAAIDLFDFSR